MSGFSAQLQEQYVSYKKILFFMDIKFLQE